MLNNDNLERGSFWLQVLSLMFILRDFDNTDLMNELQFQDEKYLKTIIQQNEEIIDLLKKGSETNGR